MPLHTLALKTAPVFIAVALPLALMSCSADDAPSNQTGGTSGGTRMGGSSGSGAGQTSNGGSSGSGATMGGGSGTGGSGGAGAPGTGGAGPGGAAGRGTAGGGGVATGGASAGGASSGGMSGASTGGASTGGASSGGMGGATGAAGTGGSAGGGAFTLTSPTHMEGAHFDAKFTCAAMNGSFGSGVNPELDWSGVPAGTKSFAMTFIDTTLGEDNSLGQHWAIWNVPWDSASGKVSTFPEGLGTTLTGDLADAKQSGKFLTPCAQSVVDDMDDYYKFTLYALSTETLAITGTTVADALTALRATTPLGTATLTGHAGLKGE